MPDDVQPAEGQGTDGDGGIFASYLSAVPDDARDAVAGYLKDAEKNVNERLAEASELKKTLGPYQQVEALNQYQPEQLSELLAWHQQVTSSDEAFQQWLGQAAQEAGFTKAEAQELEDAESEGVLSPADIEKMVSERAQQQIQPLSERFDQWERQSQIDSTETEIRDELSKLETQHKVSLNDEQKAMILDLGINHEGDGSWVQAGFDRFQAITSEGQRAFVADKSGMPGAPLTAGGTEASTPATDFKTAGEQLRERLRQNS